MYIRWQQRERINPKFGPYGKQVGEDKWVRLHDIHWSAVAVENKRINGKPTQRHIGYIVGFTESAAKIDAQCAHLWDRICERLDQLKITAADRKQIEAAIATKLPRPTIAEYKDIAGRGAQSLGWERISAKQKAALQAEQWQDHTGDLGKRIDAAAEKISPEPDVTCSFCGKSATQAHTLVTGSNANICDECIDRATVLVAERKAPITKRDLQ